MLQTHPNYVEFNNVLSNNGLVVYTDHNSTEQVCFGVFSLFCGGYYHSDHNTNIHTITGSNKCYEFAQQHLTKLLSRYKEKRSGKKGLRDRIGSTQRYLMTHENVHGTIPTYN